MLILETRDFIKTIIHITSACLHGNAMTTIAIGALIGNHILPFDYHISLTQRFLFIHCEMCQRIHNVNAFFFIGQIIGAHNRNGIRLTAIVNCYYNLFVISAPAKICMQQIDIVGNFEKYSFIVQSRNGVKIVFIRRQIHYRIPCSICTFKNCILYIDE